MKCLNDSEIQAVADGEGADEIRQHARTCARCGERVRNREQAMSAVSQSLRASVEMPIATHRRVTQALSDGGDRSSTRMRGGATRLRYGARSRRGRAFWSAVAVAAATLLVVFVILPMMKGPTTVSASEILAASANRLAQQPTDGVEFLEYELAIEGVPLELTPDRTNGKYRVRQVIDRSRAGRFLVSTHADGGALLSAVGQDPASGRRTMIVRLDGQAYRFNFTIPANASMSIPEMERLHMEASVAMMQASGVQRLQVIDGPAGRQYRVDVPQVRATSQGAVWDLSEAHLVVAADDYRVIEFAVKGMFLKQPYSLSYRLLNREVKTQAELAGDEFDVPNEPGAVTLEGEGSAIPAGDALIVALRELAKSRAR